MLEHSEIATGIPNILGRDLKRGKHDFSRFVFSHIRLMWVLQTKLFAALFARLFRSLLALQL